MPIVAWPELFVGQRSVLCDLRHMSADAITETNAITHALGYKIL